nr:AsmA family protein [uncultured Cohaesibacter sp.]
MTRTMRIRILWSTLAFLAFLVGLVMATPYLINTRLVKNQISQQISDWLGLPVTVNGEPVVTIFPYLTVKLKDIEIASSLGEDEPPLVSMQTLRAQMYWLPLLIGKFEVRRFHLIEPVFELARQKEGAFSWDLRGGSLFKTDNGRLTLSDLTLGNFQISQGAAHFKDDVSGSEERVSDINMVFDWPRTEKTASIKGTALWRDETVELQASSGKPMELFAGGLSPLSLDLSSPLFKVSLDGSAATMSNFQFEGDFSFSTSSLSNFMHWSGRDLPSGRDLGPASLSARANLVGASIALSDLDASLDKNQINGVLQLDFRQSRPMVQGTLASDVLDLAQYVRMPESIDELMHYDLTRSKAASVDFDIRLSATDLKLGPVNLGRAAASLMTRDNQVSVSIGEAYAYGGRLEATLDMKQDNEDPTRMNTSLRAKANGISAAGVTRELSGDELLTGTALMELDLQARGTHVDETLSDAHGTLSVVLTDGELNHFDLGLFQNALQEGRDIDSEKLRQGKSEFDVLSIRGQLADLALDIEGLRMTSGKRALLGTARYGFENGELDFPGTLAIYRSSDPASHSTEAPEREIPFLMSGSFDAPRISLRKVKENVVPDNKDILAPGVPQTINQGVNPALAPAVTPQGADTTQPAADAASEQPSAESGVGTQAEGMTVTKEPAGTPSPDPVDPSGSTPSKPPLSFPLEGPITGFPLANPDTGLSLKP